MRKINATGEILVEESAPVNLDVYTRVPEKYLLIDAETNQIYQGTSGNLSWRKLDVDQNKINDIVATIAKATEHV